LCFFLVKDILDSKLKPLSNPVIIRPDETEEKLQEGISIQYEGDIDLSYNVSYGGSPGVDVNWTGISGYHTSESYSHALRPDIVITKNGNTKLILDAKYKGKKDNGEFNGEETEGNIITFKEEDLDKMHTYRDALKNVFGAFALYPGNETKIYPSHKAGRPFQGVGALPLKPVSGGRPHAEHLGNLAKAIGDFLSPAPSNRLSP